MVEAEQLMLVAEEIDVEVQIQLEPGPVPLYQALAHNLCMFCGGKLPAGYKPEYSPPSQLPTNMPICQACLSELAPSHSPDCDSSD
jgi:hypothetical protein